MVHKILQSSYNNRFILHLGSFHLPEAEPEAAYGSDDVEDEPPAAEFVVPRSIFL